jgi:hypothetical protein
MLLEAVLVCGGCLQLSGSFDYDDVQFFIWNLARLVSLQYHTEVDFVCH